ncbi:MAG TPA: TetR/AcrR family transcriptional regulator [Puia sp.]|nr:TetR/AcrR family transcriptional regulator [Puia sp.]
MNKAEKTKQFIVEKTAPIFNKKGYAGTSLSDMTEATGLTKGSIYGNFANKDEVALAAFEYNWKRIAGLTRQEMDKKNTIKEKLLVYTEYDKFVNFPVPMGGCPVLNTAVEADDTHPLLKKKANEAFLAWKDRLTLLIEEGIRTKEFKASIDPEQIALTIIAMIEGGIMIAKLSGKPAYRNAIMLSMKKMIDELA